MTDKGPNLNNLEREINRLRRECAVRTPNTIATDIAQSIHIRKKQEGRLASQTGTPIRSRVVGERPIILSIAHETQNIKAVV